jgi:hypothetical protein
MKPADVPKITGVPNITMTLMAIRTLSAGWWESDPRATMQSPISISVIIVVVIMQSAFERTNAVTAKETPPFSATKNKIIKRASILWPNDPSSATQHPPSGAV